jgi:hypothetical protein
MTPLSELGRSSRLANRLVKPSLRALDLPVARRAEHFDISDVCQPMIAAEPGI